MALSNTHTLNRLDPQPAEKFRTEEGRRHIRHEGGRVNYRGFYIVEKRDFGEYGFNVNGFNVKHGYVITDGVCNIMPGGVWMLTVQDAMRAIDDLIDCQAMERGEQGEHPFWTLNRFRREAEERAPELALLLEEVFQNADVRLPGELFGKIRDVLGQIDFNCDMRGTIVYTDGSREKQGPRTTGRFGMPLKNT